MTQFEKWYKDTISIASIKTRNINTSDMEILVRIAYEEILTKVPHHFYWSKYTLKDNKYIPVGNRVNSKDIELGIELVCDSKGNKIDNYELSNAEYCTTKCKEENCIYVLKQIIKPIEECEIDVLHKIRDVMLQYIGLTLFESTASNKGADRYQMADKRYRYAIEELQSKVPEHIWSDDIKDNVVGVI